VTSQQILEKAWQIATDRAYEFDNLDKWQVKAVKKRGYRLYKLVSICVYSPRAN
jgi:hypothetical protein